MAQTTLTEAAEVVGSLGISAVDEITTGGTGCAMAVELAASGGGAYEG